MIVFLMLQTFLFNASKDFSMLICRLLGRRPASALTTQEAETKGGFKRPVSFEGLQNREPAPSVKGVRSPADSFLVGF